MAGARRLPATPASHTTRRNTVLSGGSLSGLLHRLPPYWLLLRRTPAPEGLALRLEDPWTGNPDLAHLLISGDGPFESTLLPLGPSPWQPSDASDAWIAEANGFTWIRHLRAAGGDEARAAARSLTMDWLAAPAGYDPLIWRADVVGSRIALWLAHFDYLTGDDDFAASALLQALAMHARYLAGALPGMADGHRRFTALHGMIAACWALPVKALEKRRGHVLAQLESELARQIYPDGVHFERSPAVQLSVLRTLIDIRTIFYIAHHDIPDALLQAIDRMAPILRFFRHGDGGLALFNDSNELDGWTVDQVLAQSEARGKPPLSAPHGGFQRVTCGRLLALIDTGVPSAIDDHAHAGTLSMELSLGKERLIVNCGAHAEDGSDWRRVQRATAAHSTLTIDDTNSSEVVDATHLGRRPQDVTVRRDETDGAVWLDMSHDGYVPSFRVVHRRRLYFAANGEDVRGEDSLVGRGQGTFALRFHLHPKVQATVVQNGTTVLLRLPSGMGWRLRSGNGLVQLSESIYLGQRGDMKRSRQVVITGELTEEGVNVKWALQREDTRRKP